MKRNFSGKVYLVGAGPGDPELLTLRGKKLLEKADIILYDNLVNKKLLNYASEKAEIIYVGKSSSKHTYPQNKINRLLIEKAKKSITVVRLKGGDPFVFGRGGEEALALKEAGIEVEVVPGITSAIAGPTYAGIPVTHRGMASSVRFITGHETPDKQSKDISFKNIADDNGTQVFLMGVKNIEKIVNELINNGKPLSTPVALIQNATLNSQNVITGTLENIVNLSKAKNFSPPGIIIMGDVVNLREKLNWFEKKPLFGKKVIVTRTRRQASALSELLQEYGAEPIEIPTIEIRFLKNETLKKVLSRIKRYQWIVFTSANGVDAFFSLLFDYGYDTRMLSEAKIATIGKQTAKQVGKYYLNVDFYPTRYTSECFAKEFPKKYVLNNKNILLVQSNLSRDIIEKTLIGEKAYIEKAVFYETRTPDIIPEELLVELLSSEIKWVTFTSSSTADNFFRLLSQTPELTKARSKNIQGEKILKKDKRFLIASIGPVTSQSIIKNGFKPDVEAEEHNVKGLVDAIINYEKRKTHNKS